MKPFSTAFFLFFLAPAACFFINHQLAQSPHGIPHSEKVCAPSQLGSFSSPQLYAPLGIKLDWLGGLVRGGMPCMLVDVFTTLLYPHQGYLSSPPHRTMILYFLAYIPTALFFINLSLTQLGLPILIALVGMAYQLFSAGFVISLLAAHAVNYLSFGRAGAGRRVDSIDVEAVLAGVVVGCCWPSWMIWQGASQEWTLIWQAFPVYSYLVQSAYEMLMRRIVGRGTGGSPRFALGLSYTLLSGLSLTAHLPLLHHLLTSSSTIYTLRSIFVPTISLQPTAQNHTQAVQACLQFDLLFVTFTFFALFTLRSNTSVVGKLRLAGSCVLGTIGGGPGVGTVFGWLVTEDESGKGGKEA